MFKVEKVLALSIGGDVYLQSVNVLGVRRSCVHSALKSNRLLLADPTFLIVSYTVDICYISEFVFVFRLLYLIGLGGALFVVPE